MLSPTLKAELLACVTRCYETAELKLNKTFPRPEVTFNQRGKVAGSARLQINQLRFNPVLLADNPAHFLNDVVPHEVSHLIVFQVFGKVRPHGREWQQMMSEVFDVPPRTRHSMDVSKVQGKTFTYLCGCGPMELSIRRHNKVQRNQQQYICRSCKQTLLLKT